MAEKILKSIKFPGLDDVYKIPSGGASSWEDLVDKPELFSGSWNDLSDKPFGELESKTYVYDDTLEYEEPHTGLRFRLLKISDDVLQKSDVIGGELTFIWDGEETTDIIVDEYILEDERCVDCYEILGAIVVATSENSTFEYLPLTPGIWLSNRPFCRKAILTTPSIKTLDEKFIPDTIARVSDIPDIPNINNVELITLAEIDAICGTSITVVDATIETF